MEPVFKDGDQVVINRLTYVFSRPKPEDIVTIQHPHDRRKILLKKIEKLNSDNTYFVVGENKSDSEDSRFFGKINKEGILGKFWFRY